MDNTKGQTAVIFTAGGTKHHNGSETDVCTEDLSEYAQNRVSAWADPRELRQLAQRLRSEAERAEQAAETNEFFSLDLSRLNLAYICLYKANLRQGLFAHADLEFAQLQHARLFSAFLCEADLGYANLIGADLRNAQLATANLVGADLRNAQLDPPAPDNT